MGDLFCVMYLLHLHQLKPTIDNEKSPGARSSGDFSLYIANVRPYFAKKGLSDVFFRVLPGLWFKYIN